MHHSLKIKIRDLDHIESIVEQDITDVEAEKIVGGTLSVGGRTVIVRGTLIVGRTTVCAPDDYYCLMNVPPMPDDPLPPCSIGSLAIASNLLLTKSSINELKEKSNLSLV